VAEQELGRALSEQVFEIRYRPNARILDYRGAWAELISEAVALPHWRIIENRVDIFDEEEKHRCFIGFRNAGFITRDAPTANYFADLSLKFFRKVLSLEGFVKPVFAERIGVRGKFLTPHSVNFEELLRRYSDRYLRLTDRAVQKLGAKIVDIGGNLNYADQHGNFNTVSGPMNDDQITRFFPWKDKEEIPKVGLYFDIDYWTKPSKELSEAEVLRTISAFAKEVWNKNTIIQELITGE
jgi:hypothetical protein